METVSSLDDMKTNNCHQCDNKNMTEGKDWWECNCINVEVSGCISVPEKTSINDFVRIALLKLGYPSSSSYFAAGKNLKISLSTTSRGDCPAMFFLGSILIRNWKPLSLKSICPGMNKSVGDILGDLTNVVSLRIQIFRPKITILEKIKDNLLNFFVRANQNFLKDSGCPIDPVSNMVNGRKF